jgi:hypothetical protein
MYYYTFAKSQFFELPCAGSTGKCPPYYGDPAGRGCAACQKKNVRAVGCYDPKQAREVVRWLVATGHPDELVTEFSGVQIHDPLFQGGGKRVRVLPDLQHIRTLPAGEWARGWAEK